MSEAVEMRAWVGCLACYNAGRLVGEWFDATEAGDVTPEDLHHGPTAHEELWVMDHEGLPIDGECSPMEAQRWAECISEVSEWQQHAFLAWIKSDGYVADGTDMPSVSDFEECYSGEWADFEEFAFNLFEDMGYASELPEHLAPYFDHKAWARDLAYDYSTTDAPGGGVFVFSNL